MQVSCDDCTSLSNLDVGSILDNLAHRYEGDKIYTYTANVLLSVNPYKTMHDLFNDEQKKRYRNKSLHSLPPHPYAIADTAYRYFLGEKVNQAILISGESGAGKTEAAKFVIDFLATVASNKAGINVRADIHDKVIKTTPILEAFGNAKTVRNNNSSRFGKFNRLYMDSVGCLVGSEVEPFLLESSRVTRVTTGERNFHVFYQLLAGLEPADRERLRLSKQSYPLTTPSNGSDKAGEGTNADASRFVELQASLDAVGFSREEQLKIFEALSGLLLLSEIEFVNSTDETLPEGSSEVGCCVSNYFTLQDAADMLGIEDTKLNKVLVCKSVKISNSVSSNSSTNSTSAASSASTAQSSSTSSHFYSVPRSIGQAQTALYSLMRMIYKRLFESIVNEINSRLLLTGSTTNSPRLAPTVFSPRNNHLSPRNHNKQYNHIGILDIFGFENLPINSFEQLCINLTNEKLQQFFIKKVLECEQKFYLHEGLQWTPIPLPDCSDTVACLKGALEILDDHCKRRAKELPTDDDKYCQQVLRQLSTGYNSNGAVSTSRLLPPKLNHRGSASAHSSFIVRHYAGDVEYSVSGWIEKNNDRLSPEIEQLLIESEHDWVKRLADKEALSYSCERFKSVRSKFMQELDSMLAILNECSLHFIRCFNPNANQINSNFNKAYVKEQVIQCGTIELVKVMHLGFPNRHPLSAIADKFKQSLINYPELYQLEPRRFCEVLLQAFKVEKSQYAVGLTTLFLKAGQIHILEELRGVGAQPHEDVIRSIKQSLLKKKIARIICAVKICLWLPKLLKGIKRKKYLNLVAKLTVGVTGALRIGRLSARRARERIRLRRLAEERERLRLEMEEKERVRKQLEEEERVIREAAEKERVRLEAERQAEIEKENEIKRLAMIEQEKIQKAIQLEKEEQERIRLKEEFEAKEKLRLETEKMEKEKADRIRKENEEKERLRIEQEQIAFNEREKLRLEKIKKENEEKKELETKLKLEQELKAKQEEKENLKEAELTTARNSKWLAANTNESKFTARMSSIAPSVLSSSTPPSLSKPLCSSKPVSLSNAELFCMKSTTTPITKGVLTKKSNTESPMETMFIYDCDKIYACDLKVTQSTIISSSTHPVIVGNSSSSSKSIRSLSQHPSDDQLFISVDSDNYISIWKYVDNKVALETRFRMHVKASSNSDDTERSHDNDVAIVVKAKFINCKANVKRRIIGLVVEQHSVSQINNESLIDVFFVVVETSSTTQSTANKSSKYRVLGCEAIHPSPHLGSSAINYLTISNNGHFASIGGKGILQFIHINVDSDNANLCTIADHTSFSELGSCIFTTSTFLESSSNYQVFVGSSVGNIYRFVLLEKSVKMGFNKTSTKLEGSLDAVNCGRLKQGSGGLNGKRIASFVYPLTKSHNEVFYVISNDGCIDQWLWRDNKWSRGESIELLSTTNESSSAQSAFSCGKFTNALGNTMILFDTKQLRIIAHNVEDSESGPQVVQQL